MKPIKVVVAVVILLVAIIVAVVITRATFPSVPDEPIEDMPTPSSDVVKGLIQGIDSRVSWIKERINYRGHRAHYDGDVMIYRGFYEGVDEDSFVTYAFYYDENGSLIYVEISHYRSALYDIYFHNDTLLYVTVGPFSYSGGPFIDGDISDVQTVIAEAPQYAFVLEDLAFCLSNAYQSNTPTETTEVTAYD